MGAPDTSRAMESPDELPTMKKIVVSAPGKVILHGEHAVVHGKTAIAASLGLRTCVELGPSEMPGRVQFTLPDVMHVDCHWAVEDVAALAKAVGTHEVEGAPTDNQLHLIREFLENKTEGHLPKDEPAGVAAAAFLFLVACIFDRIPAMSVHVKSQLPIGAGLGSSAAFSVALAGALAASAGHVTLEDCDHVDGDDSGELAQAWASKDAELINEFGFLAEKVIHGNPSGIDNAVACFGGAIRFTKGREQVQFAMPSLRICLTNTRVPRSTKALVAEVGRRKHLLPSVVDPILESIQHISDQCLSIFAELQQHKLSDNRTHQRFEQLELLVDMNHHLLVALGVGHPSLEKVVAITSALGLHSKLTGAGGGGCALTLIPEEIEHDVVERMVSQLEAEGFECWETAVGAVGVARHKVTPSWLKP